MKTHLSLQFLRLVTVYFVLFIIATSLALLTTYLYNYTFAWNRYWEGTQAGANERTAMTTKYLIELMGPEKISSLSKEEVKDDLSSLGYNLFFEINDGKEHFLSRYYSWNNAFLHYEISCGDDCTIKLWEDKGAHARNLNESFISWIKTLAPGGKSPFDDKYNNFTVFFLVLFIFYLIAVLLFKLLYARLSFEKERANELLFKMHDDKEQLENELVLLTQNLQEQKNDNEHELEYIELLESEISQKKEDLTKQNESINQLKAVIENSKRTSEIVTERLEAEKDQLTKSEKRVALRIREIFESIYHNLDFSIKFADKVELKPKDSVSKKVVATLEKLNEKQILSQEKKRWKGGVDRITDRPEYPVDEIDIGRKERLFVQEVNTIPYVANIDYEHKFSDHK